MYEQYNVASPVYRVMGKSHDRYAQTSSFVCATAFAQMHAD